MSKVNASEDDVEDILTPITKEEIHECMTNFHNYIDAKSQIYGCAACGIRVIVSKLDILPTVKFSDLKILQLSLHEIEKYSKIPLEYKKIYGVQVVMKKTTSSFCHSSKISNTT